MGPAAEPRLRGRRAAPASRCFRPSRSRNLYVGPLDFTLAGQPTSLVDLEHPDFERHPRFREALEAAETAELGPGDALYLPSLWWHGVSSLDEIGAMVNFWWRDGEPPHADAAQRALSCGDHDEGSAAERASRPGARLFDHYVFGDHGDPAEHLPEKARGILGRRTPELVARVKALLARALGR